MANMVLGKSRPSSIITFAKVTNNMVFLPMEGDNKSIKCVKFPSPTTNVAIAYELGIGVQFELETKVRVIGTWAMTTVLHKDYQDEE